MISKKLKWSDEQKRRHSERMKRRSADPAWRKSVSDRMKAAWSDPKYRGSQIESIIQSGSLRKARDVYNVKLLDSKYRASLSPKRIKIWSDPEFRSRRISEMVALWSNPEYRTKTMEGRERAMTPEGASRNAERMRVIANRPDVIEKRIAALVQMGRIQKSKLEIRLGDELRKQGIEFSSQVKIGRYVADFLLQNNVILECDGDYWHSLPGRKQKELIRDAYLQERGYWVVHLPERVLKRRFWQPGFIRFVNDVIDSRAIREVA